MKKFYFLNNKKNWQGPYWLFQILFFALKGIIKPETYVWHNKPGDYECEHPSFCIYARKKAVDFWFLPSWIFGSNLKILFFNAVKKLKKKFKKRNAWDLFRKKPIESPQILTGALSIRLIPSITAIHDFAAPGDFSVKLIYIDTNDKNDFKSTKYPIKILSDNGPGIRFEITIAEPPSVGGVMQKESYGLHRQLYLINENERIRIARKSVFDFSTLVPYKPQILKGRFSQANLIIPSEYKNTYNRLLLKVDDDKFISPQDLVAITGLHIYDHDKFNIHDSLMGMSFKTGGQFSEVEIENKRYHIYGVADTVYLIDGVEREDFEIFKQKAEVIRIALAMLSGKFYGGACTYVTANSSNFDKIEGVWYEIERTSIISNRRIINLHLFREHYKNERKPEYEIIDKSITSELFSKLCDKIFKEETFRHAAELVISGMGNNDPLQQGALYSVSLEALTGHLGETKSKDLKPITDNELAKKLRNEMLAIIEQYKTSIPQESFSILLKKLHSLNSPTNQDKLVKTFGLYGITLSEEDTAAIAKRNDYLHGRNPLTGKGRFELNQVSLRLHTLIVSLILKSVDYTGHVINLDVIGYLEDEDRLFDYMETQGKIYGNLIEDLEKAEKNQDEKKLKEVRGELGKQIAANRLMNLIRIV